MSIFNTDGAFIDALSAIGGVNSGIGTSRDPMTSAIVNEALLLDQKTVENLYRGNKILQKIVDLIPQDANMKPVRVSIGESGSEGAKAEEYLRKLKANSHFIKAGKMGRLYGDGYIIIGIDDGQKDFSKPVNENNIKSINWLVVRDRYKVYPDPVSREHYIVVTDPLNPIPNQETLTRIHTSRVLRIPGKELFGDMQRENNWSNDSVINAIFSEFVRFSQSFDAASSMLQSHSIFKYKMKGLSTKAAKTSTEDLLSRFRAILLGLTAIRALIFDADSEDAEFINRNYSGVDKILIQVLDLFVSVSDMPKSKILESSNSSAFSEGGLSDRYQWASTIESYQNLFLKDEYEKLVRYIFLAKDSGFSGEPADWDIQFPSILQLTQQEQAALEYQIAQTDEIRLRSGVLVEQEVRDSRYSGSSFGLSITLDPAVDLEKIKEENMKQQMELAQQGAKRQKADSNTVMVNGCVLPLSEYEFEDDDQE